MGPVVFGLGPKGSFFVAGLCGFECLFEDGAFTHFALLAGEAGIEPVVSDGYGACHFSGVEEVTWVPVLEGAGIPASADSKANSMDVRPGLDLAWAAS